MTPTSAPPLFDYDRLRDSLVDAGVVVALAELHGGICGALCASGEAGAKRWLADCLADDDVVEAAIPIAAELEAVIGASAAMLADRQLEFEPLVPDDETPLEEQVQALALWCQGFLSALGTTAPKTALAEAEGAPLTEILRDFAEISRAGLSEDEAAGQGQADFALAEIHEYVRVSVQIVFEDLAPVRAASARDVH